MGRVKKYIITVVTSALLVLLTFALYNISDRKKIDDKIIKIGFVYVGDESTPYTENYIKAQEAIEAKYGDRAIIYVKNNVPEGNEREAVLELCEEGCDLIFSTSYGYQWSVKEIAAEYPDIQFCQATGDNANEEPFYDNYHTFMGEIYQGRYVAGVVAGMKLKQLIDNGEITENEAVIGYVAAYPYAEVISGYTAFLLGARSVVPETTMRVKYVNTWSSYQLEKKCAEELIQEDCIIISQHSDTTGPAIACEEATEYEVFHVGYNQSMLDVAPTTSLIGSRINWTPYMLGAVQAVMEDKRIEAVVSGNVHGNDMGGGFKQDWVQMLELNELIAAPGTSDKIDEMVETFCEDGYEVFKGDYLGVNPYDETDIIDLNNGYIENAEASAPTFNYILQDVIIIE